VKEFIVRNQAVARDRAVVLQAFEGAQGPVQALSGGFVELSRLPVASQQEMAAVAGQQNKAPVDLAVVGNIVAVSAAAEEAVGRDG
jgi:hypothetical protein